MTNSTFQLQCIVIPGLPAFLHVEYQNAKLCIPAIYIYLKITSMVEKAWCFTILNEFL